MERWREKGAHKTTAVDRIDRRRFDDLFSKTHSSSKNPAKYIYSRDSCAKEIDKPNSVPDRNRVAIISLGRSLPIGSCGLPARLATSSRCVLPKKNRSHAWPCSCWGLPGRTHCCAAGELLPRLFTLTVRPWRVFTAVCFCGPAPRVTAPGRYPAACSMEFGLSSGGSSPPAIT